MGFVDARGMIYFYSTPSPILPSLNPAEMMQKYSEKCEHRKTSGFSWNIYDILARMIPYLHTLNINRTFFPSFFLHFLHAQR